MSPLSFALGILMLMCLDVAVCRVHYAVLVHQTVTTPKREAKASVETATDENGVEVCNVSEQLKAARDTAKATARSWHPAGGGLARLFDYCRAKPTRNKTCLQNFKSADRIDVLASVIAASCGGIAVALMYYFVRPRHEKPQIQWSQTWRKKLEEVPSTLGTSKSASRSDDTEAPIREPFSLLENPDEWAKRYTSPKSTFSPPSSPSVQWAVAPSKTEVKRPPTQKSKSSLKIETSLPVEPLFPKEENRQMIQGLNVAHTPRTPSRRRLSSLELSETKSAKKQK